jgi:hypothetical protein
VQKTLQPTCRCGRCSSAARWRSWPRT